LIINPDLRKGLFCSFERGGNDGRDLIANVADLVNSQGIFVLAIGTIPYFFFGYAIR